MGGLKCPISKNKESPPIDPTAVRWAVSFIDRFENSAEKFGILHGVEKQPDGSMTLPKNESSGCDRIHPRPLR